MWTQRSRPIRLTDVAKAAGVSHGTASNVFSRPEIVREEVRERVKAAAEKLGYGGPDPKGRLLRAGKVNAIGVATARATLLLFRRSLLPPRHVGHREACDRRAPASRWCRQPTTSSSPGTSAARWSTASSSFARRGLVLVELARERRTAFRHARLRFERPDDLRLSASTTRAGARMAARHLAGLGHRRFAILSLPVAEDRHGPATYEHVCAAIYSGTRDRIRGYADVLVQPVST